MTFYLKAKIAEKSRFRFFSISSKKSRFSNSGNRPSLMYRDISYQL